MMLWRARTFAGRALFADALRGMTSSYEAEDYQVIEGTVASVETVPVTTQPAVSQPAAKITQDQARDFGKAWKASGYAMAEAKEALKRICGVESSLDIPVDKYQQAMTWAATVKEQPKAAATEVSEDEKQSREAFAIVGWDARVQARFVEQYASDWKKILGEMRILVMKREEQL